MNIPEALKPLGPAEGRMRYVVWHIIGDNKFKKTMVGYITAEKDIEVLSELYNLFADSEDAINHLVSVDDRLYLASEGKFEPLTPPEETKGEQK
jgi:hypothetical protein